MKYDFFLSGLEEHRKNKVLASIKIIEEAKEKGSIRNVIYNDVKDSINRACWDFDSKMKPRFSHENSSYALRNFSNDIGYINSLHSIISIRKKVDKMKERDALVDYYDRISAELLDLALTMKDLKSKVVKGRDPEKKPAPPANPNKIVKTCGCCLRTIAIGSDKKMVHHGFKRPGDGYQTESCEGIKFKCLEISDEGPKFMVKILSELLDREKAKLKEFKSAKSFTFLNYQKKMETLNEGDFDFPYYKKNMISRQTFRVNSVERDLETFKKIVKEWKPTEIE